MMKQRKTFQFMKFAWIIDIDIERTVTFFLFIEMTKQRRHVM